nr:hypothetical protein [Tanacetum cinerariifolium]
MCTRSSSNLPVESPPNPSTSNPKRRNRRRSKQPFILKESPVDTMANQRTMAELLRAPTEGYAEAIVVPSILGEQFELKHGLINMMTSDHFFGLEKDNPHDHIRWGSPSVARKRTFAFYSHLGGSCFQIYQLILSPSRTTNLRNEISKFQQRFDESFHKAWDRYTYLLRACPHHGLTELHQLDTFYNALNPTDQDSLNSAAGGNLLERRTQDVLTIIENKSKIAKLTYAVNKQTSVVTTAMTVILKQFQATPPPASVKAVEEICVTYGGAHPYYQCLAADGNTLPELRDNIQGYVAATAVNYNQGELKAITTQSGIVIDGPSVPIPPPFINPEEDERVEETLTDQDLADGYPQKFPEKFLISCGFSELKCKALADLGVIINLMPLSIWKKLGLPEFIFTRMTFELANRAICTPAGIARDVFFPVSKITFPADFVIVDYESDPRVPFILERPFLRTAHALIDVHGEKMILRDGDERLTLNMRDDTSSYSNQPQKESINMINIYDDSNDVFDPEGGNVIPEKLLDLDSTKDLHPPHHANPLSGNTTSSSSQNHLLEEFADELALITFPPGNDDLSFDIKSDLKEIEYLLHHDHIKRIDSSLKDPIDQSNLNDLNDNLADIMPEMFNDKHALDYSSPALYDEYDDELFKVDDFLPSPKYDSFLSEDFSEVNALPSTNNEDKVFNPGILIQKTLFKVITCVAPEKREKKLAISHASLILEDFDPPLYELSFFKEVPRSKILLSFSFENKEKVFKPGILTSKEVHSSLIPELSHQGYKVFKINQILKSPMKIFLFSSREDIHILDVPCLDFYPLDQLV